MEKGLSAASTWHQVDEGPAHAVGPKAVTEEQRLKLFVQSMMNKQFSKKQDESIFLSCTFPFSRAIQTQAALTCSEQMVLRADTTFTTQLNDLSKMFKKTIDKVPNNQSIQQ